MSHRQRFVSPTRSPKLAFNVTRNNLGGLRSVHFAAPLPAHLRVFEHNQGADVGVSLASSSAMCRKPYMILYNLATDLSVFYTSDKYKDINVISDSLSYDADLFRQQCVMLKEFHRALNQDNIVRLRIPVHRVAYVQISHEVGFLCHQVAFQRFFMMVFCSRHMLKDLDEHGTHNISVSVLCWDSSFARLLLVRELNGHAWKLVSGSVHLHERYAECCIRETFEETGLNVRHLSTFALHEATHFVQNKSKLHLFCNCTTNLATVNPNSSMIYHNAMDLPLCYIDPADSSSSSDAIAMNPHELADARWFALDELLHDDFVMSTLDRHVVALVLLSLLRDWQRDEPAPVPVPLEPVPPRVSLCDRPLAEREHVRLLRAAVSAAGRERIHEAALRIATRPEQGARTHVQPSWSPKTVASVVQGPALDQLQLGQ